MKVLVVTTEFSTDPKNANLITDLTDELVAQGNEVTVVWTDWSGRCTEGELLSPKGLRLLAFRPCQPAWLPPILQKAAKWALTGAVVNRNVKRRLGGERFDLVIGFSPALIGRALVTQVKRATGAHAYLVQWDFFPVHHGEIGVLPGGAWIRRMALAMERAAIAQYDAIGLMSPANVEFFRKYHPILASRHLEVLPLWGRTDGIPIVDRLNVRDKLGLPRDRLLAVFGGQLTAGRGLDEIMRLAERTRTTIPQVVLVVVGRGPLFEPLRREIARRCIDNVVLLPRLVREEYLELLAACDVALVATVPNVTVPTFPSKTIDYLRVGLPILASTEATTDYGTIIQDEAQAGLCSRAGDLDALEANLRRLSEDAALRDALGKRGRTYFNEHLDVARICRQVLRSVESRSLGVRRENG